MASQFSFSLALHRSAKVAAANFVEHGNFATDEKNAMYDKMYSMMVERGLDEFRATSRIMKKTAEIYQEETGVGKSAYWIGVSPDTDKISLNDFSKLCEKFVTRIPVKTFVLSYEQRGKDNVSIGDGFHAHIMIWRDTKGKAWRSQGEVLRDCQSTFKSCCAGNCIEVKTVWNPEEIIQDYLIDYKSNDGHKIVTKETDKIWRNRYNIRDVYKTDNCLSVVIDTVPSSPLGTV